MASIAGALERIKRDPLGVLDRDVIGRVCEDNHYAWRDRELDPATTLALFVQQVIHGNCPCAEVRHLGGGSFTASAYCQARARLPLQVYQDLQSEAIDRALPHTRDERHLWHGHRTFHVDGSTFSMPDTPELREAFGTPSGQTPGCGFPVAHLLCLFSAATGILLDTWASPLRTGDLAQTPAEGKASSTPARIDPVSTPLSSASDWSTLSAENNFRGNDVIGVGNADRTA